MVGRWEMKMMARLVLVLVVCEGSVTYSVVSLITPAFIVDEVLDGWLIGER